MKKLYLFLLGIISAICLTVTAAFAAPMAKADGEPTGEPTESGSETTASAADYLGETKMRISNDFSKVLIVTAVKNLSAVYELGYTLTGAGDVLSGETAKYYTSVTTNSVTQTVAELFGEGYEGMIIWEAGYSTNAVVSATPYVKIGEAVEGGIDTTNSQTISGATKTSELTVAFGESEQKVNFGAELTVPAAPSKDNYEFIGWKLKVDGSEGVYDFSAENAKRVTSNMSFLAAYKPIITFTAPASSLTVGDTLTITAPTAAVDLTISAEIKLKSATDWSAISLTEGYTVNELGMHEVKITASYEGGSEQKTYNVWVRDKNVIADFELEPDDSNHGWISEGKTDYTFAGTLVSGEDAISGSYSIKVGAASDSWTVFKFKDESKSVMLTEATNTFEFTANAGKDISGYQLGFYEGSSWIGFTVDIKEGTQKYTITCGNNIKTIDELWFINCYKYMANSEDTSAWIIIDDIKAIIAEEDDDEQKLGAIQTGYSVGTANEIDFPFENATNPTATLKKSSDDSSVTVTVASGKVSFTLETAGEYALTLDCDETEARTYKILAREANSLSFGDFESGSDGTHHGDVAHYADFYGNVYDCISDEWSANGSYSWKFATEVGSGWYGRNGLSLDVSGRNITKVVVYINATNAIQGFQLWFVTDSGSVYANSGSAVTVSAGVTKLELSLTLPAGSTKLTAFEFGYSGGMSASNIVYFDGFALIEE